MRAAALELQAFDTLDVAHRGIDISPDQVITLWYHWPDGDDQPSQPPIP